MKADLAFAIAEMPSSIMVGKTAIDCAADLPRSTTEYDERGGVRTGMLYLVVPSPAARAAGGIKQNDYVSVKMFGAASFVKYQVIDFSEDGVSIQMTLARAESKPGGNDYA